jgi:hypothetical protein
MPARKERNSMSAQPIYVDEDEFDDPKTVFPPGLLTAPPVGHTAGEWSSHTRAFGSKGLGDTDPAPLVTLVYRR